ncbi:MAG: sugar ABC transporter substrate-binding protein [Actinobacteria bacterium]|nr:sugar ABC transporter substrate-binding protein [Actinomycetota bacterium]
MRISPSKKRSAIALGVAVALAIPAMSTAVAATKKFPKSLPAPEFVNFQKPKAGSGKGLTLGYISLGDSVPFVKLVSDSIKAEAKRAGAKLEFCDSQIDAAKALACAQLFKTKKVQAYLNFQFDAAAGPSIYNAGPQVPVIAIDINQTPKQVSFMGANNTRAGVVAGTGLGNLIKKQFNCKYDAIVLMESPGVGAVNEARIGGNRQGFASVCGALDLTKVKSIDSSFIEKAQASFKDALTTLPDAKVIVVMPMNDDSALGALAAAKQVGREKDVWVMGHGADPTSWCEIKNNPQWAGDVAYFPERYGEIGIPYLIQAARGKAIPEKLQVNHVWVDKSNINKYYPNAKCS